MKKINVMGLVLAVVLSLSVSVMGAVVEPAQNVGSMETGTYRVTVSEGKDIGFFVVNDEAGNAVDYVVIQENDYGYIYFDAAATGCTYDIKDVDCELVSNEDLGVSGYHVFEIIKGHRDYDPIVDKQSDLELPYTSEDGKVPGIVYLEDLSAEEMSEMFS